MRVIVIATVLLLSCSDSSETLLASGGDAGTADAENDAGLVCRPRSETCGDTVCDVWETCRECARDCGECATCAIERACTLSAAPPSSHEELSACENDNNAEYSCGTEFDREPFEGSCLDPELRLRITKLKVRKNGANGAVNMFCAVTASDALRSELYLTRELAGVRDNAPDFTFNPSQGTFWGQERNADESNSCEPFLPFYTNGNLTISYQCFAVKSGAFANVAQSVADASAGAAGIPGVGAGTAGWVFAGVSVAGNLLSTATSGATEETMLDVTQTIDSQAFYELIKGKRWSVRREFRDGGALSPRTDVEIEIEAWGCADARSVLQ